MATNVMHFAFNQAVNIYVYMYMYTHICNVAKQVSSIFTAIYTVYT